MPVEYAAVDIVVCAKSISNFYIRLFTDSIAYIQASYKSFVIKI